MHLTTNGKPCVSDNAFWQGMAELSGKNGPDYSTPAGPFAPAAGPQVPQERPAAPNRRRRRRNPRRACATPPWTRPTARFKRAFCPRRWKIDDGAVRAV